MTLSDELRECSIDIDEISSSFWDNEALLEKAAGNESIIPYLTESADILYNTNR